VDEGVFLAVHQPSLDAGVIGGYQVYSYEEQAMKRQEIRRETCELVLNQVRKAFQESYILWGTKGAEVAGPSLVECRPYLLENSLWGVPIKRGKR